MSKINKKVYYYVEMQLVSPLSIGNGLEEHTDNDILLNGEGVPFIPGTSVAGVFTDFLKTLGEKDAFQPKKFKEHIQSPVFFSDAVLTGEYSKDIRDGIRLKEDEKITDDTGKYDYEVIDSGAKFILRMEETLYEGYDDVYQDYLKKCIKAMNEGMIAFGGSTTRGLGKVKVLKAGIKEFTRDNTKGYFDFNVSDYNQYETLDYKDISLETNYTVIHVPLKLKGGISIRKYNANAGEEDFHHITHRNDEPLIPGSSWNGMIRKQFRYYYENILGHDSKDTKELFGIVDGNQVIKSKVIIDESDIHDSTKVMMTRTKIDRFTGGNVDKALFTESIQYYGNTNLVIRIPDVENKDEVIGVFLLIIKDINNGFIALGGQSSIGRGLFEVDNNIGITMNGKAYDEEVYMKALGGRK